MAGFPAYFHVNAGHPVLQHPLYLKYNVMTFKQINDIPDGFQDIKGALAQIMLTNDNMAIIWYLSNLLLRARQAGFMM